MLLTLPTPVATFFAAQREQTSTSWQDASLSMPSCMTKGRTIEGPPAIRQWMKEAKAKYKHTTEPREVANRAGRR